MTDIIDIDLDGPPVVDIDLPDIDAAPAAPVTPGGFTMRPYQAEAVNEFWRGLEPCEHAPEGFKRQIIVLPTGCLARDTLVMRSDGVAIPVHCLRPGDRVQGIDGPRTILWLNRGRQMMYRIAPTKGDAFVCNEDHILTLKRTREYPGQRAAGALVDISVRDYLATSAWFKHTHKLFRVPVAAFEAEPTPLPIEPYFMGVILGDGSCYEYEDRGGFGLLKNVSVTTADPEIEAEVRRQATLWGLRLRVERMTNNAAQVYHLVGPITGRGEKKNALAQAVKYLGAAVQCCDKAVPLAYRQALRFVRAEVLAGLLDTDGHLTHSGRDYDFVSRSPTLAEDVCFLARSLGLAAYMKPCLKGAHPGHREHYYRVSISGNTEIIPCRIPRKKARGARRQKKDVLVTGFAVQPVGEDDYYGFTLDGDGRFLLGDFTVTHNCGKTVVFSEITRTAVSRGWRVLILAHRDELLDQAAKKLRRSSGLVAEKEKGKFMASSEARVVVASVQTLQKRDRLLGFSEDEFQLIIIDECHRSLAKGYQDILAYFKSARVLGVTATPDRGDKRNLGELFDRVAFSYSLIDAVQDGWLVRPIARQIPVSIDVRGIRTSRTSEGLDFNLSEVAERLEPLITELARMITIETMKRGQGIVFMPNVATTHMMTQALNGCGVDAVGIDGADQDRERKRDAFLRGEYKVLVNAMLFTEGFDYDAIDWVCPLRLTKIVGLYRQMVGRGTRTIEGLVDKCATATERKAAIAASAKRDLLILDFLWNADKIKLVGPAHLVTDRAEVAEKIAERESPETLDLLDAKVGAERDLLASLEKAALENAKKKRRTIDPLTFAVTVHDEQLRDFDAKERWELEPPTPGQLAELERAGFNISKVEFRGQATLLLRKLTERRELGLCTLKQLAFLTAQGHPEPEFVKFEEAQRLITAKMREWGAKRTQRSQEEARNSVRAGVRGLMGCPFDLGIVTWLEGLAKQWSETPQHFPTGFPAVLNMLANHTNPAVRLALTRFQRAPE